jgi:hypothetical protein
MKNYNFNQTGGFPVTTQILEGIEETALILQLFAGMCGNLSIVTGCTVTGTQVSDGLVYINGELLKFTGGGIQDYVIISETSETAQFEDGTTKIISINRFATFGISSTQYAFADFKRVPVLNLLEQRFTQINTAITAINTAIQNVGTQLAAHIANTNNPHAVTLEQVGIIKRGTIFIGDVQGKPLGWSFTGDDYTVVLIARNANSSTGGDDLYRVTLNNPLPVSDYIIATTFAYDGGYNDNNDITMAVSNKTSTSFEISIREFSLSTQNAKIDYVILKK